MWYLFCCLYSHNVAPEDKFIALVTTKAETDDPEIKLKPGVDLLGPVDDVFYETLDRFEPRDDGAADSCFVSTARIKSSDMSYLFDHLEQKTSSQIQNHSISPLNLLKTVAV
uniref:Guanosine nucleotide diphosphate dissociation inhibitor n=1 Tax=Helianthus annuus TaxID=4232 RepID=A0A251S794_HELAN